MKDGGGLALAIVLSACAAGAVARAVRGGNGGGGGPGGGGPPPDAQSEVIVLSDLNSDGTAQVFDARLGGTSQVDLSGPIVDGGTAKKIGISPDRAHLAFIASKDAPQVDELYVVDLRTPGPPVKVHPTLGSGQHVRDFQWAPDSSRIAYVADQVVCGFFQLFTSLADGSGNVQVLPDSAGAVVFPLGDEFDGSVAAFRWNRDARYLACATDDPDTDVFDLWVATPTANFTCQLAPNNEKSSGLPMWRRFQRPYIPFEWSTDVALGDRIAYLVDALQDTGNGVVHATELRIIAADRSDDRRLSHSFALHNSDPDDLRFAWAPDGRRIVYASDGEVRDRIELWSTDPRTHDPDHDSFRISKFCSGNLNDVAYLERDAFEWAPDSSRVAFRGDLDRVDSLELFSADPTVADPPNWKINQPLEQSGQNVKAFRWSPDSTRVAYIADETQRDVFELFSASPTGTDHRVVSRIDPSCDGDVLFEVDAQNPAYSAFDEPIAWSPDSRRIAYIADQASVGVFEAFAALSDGSNNFRLCKELTPVGGDVCRVRWFDSTLLLYAADERERGRFELMSAFTDGPTGTIVTGADRRGGTFCPDFEVR